MSRGNPAEELRLFKALGSDALNTSHLWRGEARVPWNNSQWQEGHGEKWIHTEILKKEKDFHLYFPLFVLSPFLVTIMSTAYFKISPHYESFSSWLSFVPIVTKPFLTPCQWLMYMKPVNKPEKWKNTKALSNVTSQALPKGFFITF